MGKRLRERAFGRPAAGDAGGPPLLLLEWPQFGSMRLLFATDGRFYSLCSCPEVGVLTEGDRAEFSRAIDWGRDVRSPVPAGWRLAAISAGEAWDEVASGRQVFQ